MDLICFSHLRWGFVFQRPNHLMSRFARQQRVFFVEEPVFDEHSVASWMQEEAGPDQLLICTPHLPTAIADREDIVCAARRALLDELIVRHGITPHVLWFYTPMALRYARHLDAQTTVYDCMDELSAFLFAPAELTALEDELLKRADVVFTGGQRLFRAKRDRHDNVHAFPSSVDAAHFALAATDLGDPRDQAPIPHPRIGFYGVIDERIDRALIAQVAAERPAWQLVMVGPVVKIDPTSLPCAPNIHWLGQKHYDSLPRYLSGWDVAFMPFAINAATAFISPTKTLEYLAAGKRIVSTPIEDVVQPYGALGVVEIADRDGFVTAIERVLDADNPERAGRAAALVANTSWEHTWRAMQRLIRSPAITVTTHHDPEALYV